MLHLVCLDSLKKSRVNNRIIHFVVKFLPCPGPFVNPALLVRVCPCPLIIWQLAILLVRFQLNILCLLLALFPIPFSIPFLSLDHARHHVPHSICIRHILFVCIGSLLYKYDLGSFLSPQSFNASSNVRLRYVLFLSDHIVLISSLSLLFTQTVPSQVNHNLVV